MVDVNVLLATYVNNYIETLQVAAIPTYVPKYTPPLSIFLQPSLPPFGACSKVEGHLQEYDVLVKLSIALLYLEKDVILLNNFYNAPSAWPWRPTTLATPAQLFS